MELEYVGWAFFAALVLLVVLLAARLVVTRRKRRIERSRNWAPVEREVYERTPYTPPPARPATPPRQAVEKPRRTNTGLPYDPWADPVSPLHQATYGGPYYGSVDTPGLEPDCPPSTPSDSGSSGSSSSYDSGTSSSSSSSSDSGSSGSSDCGGSY